MPAPDATPTGGSAPSCAAEIVAFGNDDCDAQSHRLRSLRTIDPRLGVTAAAFGQKRSPRVRRQGWSRLPVDRGRRSRLPGLTESDGVALGIGNRRDPFAPRRVLSLAQDLCLGQPGEHPWRSST
jgi:hypothetical protein